MKQAVALDINVNMEELLKKELRKQANKEEKGLIKNYKHNHKKSILNDNHQVYIAVQESINNEVLKRLDKIMNKEKMETRINDAIFKAIESDNFQKVLADKMIEAIKEEGNEW